MNKSYIRIFIRTYDKPLPSFIPKLPLSMPDYWLESVLVKLEVVCKSTKY